MIQNKSSTCNSLYMNVISFILYTDSTNVQKILLLDTGFSLHVPVLVYLIHLCVTGGRHEVGGP